MDGFNCLKATEPLQGDSLLFTISFQDLLVLSKSTLDRWKVDLILESHSGFEPETPELEIQHLNKKDIVTDKQLIVMRLIVNRLLTTS